MNSTGIKKHGYNDYHTVAYDAVWAVALALDKAKNILKEKVE
jgi:ABC-type branched-subunit amino acid transport system substrate-binding protein